MEQLRDNLEPLQLQDKHFPMPGVWQYETKHVFNIYM